MRVRVRMYIYVYIKMPQREAGVFSGWEWESEGGLALWSMAASLIMIWPSPTILLEIDPSWFFSSRFGPFSRTLESARLPLEFMCEHEFRVWEIVSRFASLVLWLSATLRLVH